MSSSLATPPPELASAISQASADYNVPPDLLTGIWRIESGSSFPNPYKNSLGYGGLFGTTHWNTSTLDQADTAASILHSLIVSNKGSIAQALYGYSGHGYTAVPGETTFGTWSTNPGSGSSGSVGMPGSDTFPGVAPGLTGGGGTSDQASGGGCSAVAHVSVLGVHIPYPDVACIAERTVNAVYDPIRPIIDKIVYFFQHIGNYAQRGGLILAGGILILIGLFKLTGGSLSGLASAVPVEA